MSEWSSGPLLSSRGWRRFEWALFIGTSVLLVASAVSYRRGGDTSAGSVLLNVALVAMTGGPLFPERFRVARWIAIAAAIVFLGLAFRTM